MLLNGKSSRWILDDFYGFIVLNYKLIVDILLIIGFCWLILIESCVGLDSVEPCVWVFCFAGCGLAVFGFFGVNLPILYSWWPNYVDIGALLWYRDFGYFSEKWVHGRKGGFDVEIVSVDGYFDLGFSGVCVAFKLERYTSEYFDCMWVKLSMCPLVL
jgi:hypothetical protein